ncbi:response regulator [Pantoea sp.]|uniref:response regulator n=1 Tax=Pantoea sp. TaxID=69393 RepID=UPI0028AF8D1D|nr:response regulator [Pantoea sp.]
MNMTPLILLAEDDAEIADIVIAYLKQSGFETLHAANGKQALDLYDKTQPALVILDIRMPLMDGWQVLTELRRRGDTPVLMLTANDDNADKLSALRIGADDYVVKPFNPAEVVARTQAILRRTGNAQEKNKPRVTVHNQIEFYHDEHRIILRHSGEDIASRLTSTEFRILERLAEAPRKVFSRLEILESCLPQGETLERTVDSHISKLRKKLEDAGLSGIPESVRGFGYRLGD